MNGEQPTGFSISCETGWCQLLLRPVSQILAFLYLVVRDSTPTYIQNQEFSSSKQISAHSDAHISIQFADSHILAFLRAWLAAYCLRPFSFANFDFLILLSFLRVMLLYLNFLGVLLLF